MNRFFAMLRYSKKLRIIAIFVLLDFLLIVGALIFDIIELLKAINNSASLSLAFLPINIALIALCAVNIISIIIFIVTKKLKEKKYEQEKN